MKFSLLSTFIGLCAVTCVTASPVASSGLTVPMDNGLETRTPSLEPFSAKDAAPEPDASTLDLTTTDHVSDIAERDLYKSFRIHVVGAGARVIGIIIIDYILREMTSPDENLSASFNRLTNVPTNGNIVAARFDNPSLFGAAQSATFDFSTRMVSGVLDLSMNAVGDVVGVRQAVGIHLGNLVVAKALHIFDNQRVRVGTVNL
ncbi:hypothetical protein EJ07DRAFT_166516 [Lizonia empirigonia]|nr:hypothetical protein EJ07DRAFT_166516 [Lizonia empirigonia]